MKLALTSLFVVSVLVLAVPLAFAEEFMIEFPDHAVFIKGEAVIVHAWGVNFDSKSQLTGIILDNIGTQIDSVEFDIERTTDVGDYGWTRIETNNSNYQTGVLYTIKTTYQGIEKQLQFTLSEPPLTNEELTALLSAQSQQDDSRITELKSKIMELENQVARLNGIIETLENQIDTLVEEFFVTIQNQFDWFRTQLLN